MICLALDTSGPLCQVALVADGPCAIEAEKILQLNAGHAEHVFRLIDEILNEASLAISDIDRIGVTTGPGSFTGLRVGLAAAKGLGLALGCPVVGVSTFELAFLSAPTFHGVTWVALDARRGQYYVHQFDLKGEVGANAAPQMLDYEHIGQYMTPDVRLITNHSEINAALKPQVNVHSVIKAQLNGLILARRAMSLEPDEYDAEPLYVREPDAKRPENLSVGVSTHKISNYAAAFKR